MTDRQTIQTEMEQKIAAGEAKIEQLKAKLEGADDDVKEEISSAIGAAEGVVEKGKSKLAQLADAADDEFDELWAGTKEAWHKVSNELEEGWHSLSDRVKSFLS